jgi:hypothetical protein
MLLTLCRFLSRDSTLINNPLQRIFAADYFLFSLYRNLVRVNMSVSTKMIAGPEGTSK